MRHYFEELRDFFKKGDMFLLVLCLIVSGFGLVCIASATSADKFDGNFRYLAVQTVSIGLGVLMYALVSSIDVDSLSEHRGMMVAFNCFLLLLLIRQPVFSLARYFQNAGYQTAGLHLMDRSNYNRNTIYPLLASRPSGRWRIMTRWTPCADMPPTGTITRS